MKSNNKPGLQKPVAILVLYEPGFRFKLHKYYLKAGKNYIGSHRAAHIKIDQAAQYAATITITSDMIYIESLASEAVYVPSNLVRDKKLMVELQPQIKYALPMEKDFIICKNKALMQIISLSELLQVKNVENQSKFIRSSQDCENESDHTQKLADNDFEGTLPLDDNFGFEPTVIMNNDAYDATLPLENNIYQATLPLEGGSYEPTINLDHQFYEPTMQLQSNFERQNQSTLLDFNEDTPKFSQNHPRNLMVSQSRRIITASQFAAMNLSLPNSIISQQSQHGNRKSGISSENLNKKLDSQKSQNEVDVQVSMVSTIRDQMPQTIQDTEFMMSATLRQENEQSSSKNKLSQSLPIKSNRFEKSQKKNFHSLQYDKAQEKQINDFQDLFGSAQNMMMLSDKNIRSDQRINQEKQGKISAPHDPLKAEKSSNRLPQNRRNSKNSSNKQKIEVIKQIEEQRKGNDKKLIKAGIVSCRKEEIKTKQLRDKGFQIVDHPDQQFQILFIGNNGLKLSKRLLLCLIEGKQIKSINSLSDPKAKINGKLEGFLWEHIEKRKGKKSIFSGKYYLQQQLREEFLEVMQKAGAQMVSQLKKSDSKLNICLIIDEKSDQGKELYFEKKNYKKWKFFKKRMVIESVLMGEQIKQKHQIDQYEI